MEEFIMVLNDEYNQWYESKIKEFMEIRHDGGTRRMEDGESHRQPSNLCQVK